MKNHNFDMELLRTFVTIVDLGGFSLAAKNLNLTQSAVSHHMKRLEDRLNRRLLKVVGRKKTITEDGEVFLNYAKRIIALNDELYIRMQSEKKEIFILGMPEYFADPLLSKVLAQFHLHNDKKVNLDVVVDSNSNLSQAVTLSEIDIALIIGLINTPSKDTIAYEALVWQGHKAYEGTSKQPVSLVVFKAPCPFRQTIINTLDSNGIPWAISHTAGSFSDMVAAIDAELGITALPGKIANSKIKSSIDYSALPKLPELEVRFIYPSITISKNVSELMEIISSVWNENIH